MKRFKQYINEGKTLRFGTNKVFVNPSKKIFENLSNDGKVRGMLMLSDMQNYIWDAWWSTHAAMMGRLGYSMDFDDHLNYTLSKKEDMLYDGWFVMNEEDGLRTDRTVLDPFQAVDKYKPLTRMLDGFAINSNRDIYE